MRKDPIVYRQIILLRNQDLIKKKAIKECISENEEVSHLKFQLFFLFCFFKC